MLNEADRNQEYSESINTDKQEYLNAFVKEFEYDLDDIAHKLDSEYSKVLISWVKDRLHKLHEDFNADL